MFWIRVAAVTGCAATTCATSARTRADASIAIVLARTRVPDDARVARRVRQCGGSHHDNVGRARRARVRQRERRRRSVEESNVGCYKCFDRVTRGETAVLKEFFVSGCAAYYRVVAAYYEFWTSASLIIFSERSQSTSASVD